MPCHCLIVVEVIDMVTYDRLWETMKAKGVTQYRLIKYYGISAGQIGRLKKNMYVSTHTLDVLCNILKCPVEALSKSVQMIWITYLHLLKSRSKTIRKCMQKRRSERFQKGDFRFFFSFLQSYPLGEKNCSCCSYCHHQKTFIKIC